MVVAVDVYMNEAVCVLFWSYISTMLYAMCFGMTGDTLFKENRF